MKRGLVPWILIAGFAGACNTGLVSIGDDRTPECQPDDCGDLPSESPWCADMAMGTYVCAQDMNYGCAWVLSCPSLACAPEACGEPVLGPPMCMNSEFGWGYACDLVDMQCSWQGVCPEAARECAPSECGPVSLTVAECMGGPGEGVNCLSDAAGNCRWTAVVCTPP